jgi:cysteine desulfurase/selenocysteine lyase
LVIDAAQSIKHEQHYKNADIICFSGHKMYGPMGGGVLAADRKLLKESEPLLYGGSMIHRVTPQETTWAEAPAKFEAGTPNVAAAVGLAAAVEYYKKLQSFAVKREKELGLAAYDILAKHATVHSKRGSTILSFSIPGVHSHDVAQVLDGYGVCVRAGQHCCEPLHDALGVKETVRVSLGLYNNEQDLQRLDEALGQVKKVFK